VFFLGVAVMSGAEQLLNFAPDRRVLRVQILGRGSVCQETGGRHCDESGTSEISHGPLPSSFGNYLVSCVPGTDKLFRHAVVHRRNVSTDMDVR
jgi:hypothetical protein